jgi:hypothetical protein
LNKIYLILFLVVSNGIALSQNSPQLIVDDMTLPPDAALHGVPGYYSWASGAANGQNPVPDKNNQGEWFHAMTGWGQVYIPVQGSPAVNTRCQIRNLVSELLMMEGEWKVVQSAGPQGAAFVEDFAGNASIDAGIRDESDNGGGISVLAGVGLWAGYNFHYWPFGSRAEVNVDSVIGVFTTCEARLIVDDPSLPDDRAICKNILQMGADWWLNLTTGWLPDWSANSGIGNGRAKWVTTEWQSFNFCSLSPDEILANPPIFTSSLKEDYFTVNQINISPNPTKGKINISIPKEAGLQNLMIFVYDLMGNIKLQRVVNKNDQEIDVNCLANGIYLLNAIINGKIMTGRFVKE